MDKCVIKPQVKNKNGEYVDSELFSSLLHYTGDREIAKQYYAVGSNPEFLSRVANKAEFDDNGEITFKSLKNLSKLKVNDEKVKQVLNKDIGSGIYDYNKAMVKLQSFNRNSQYNDEYMATIFDRGEGKVELRVVDRNNTNEAALNESISNRSLQDRIKYYLNRAGVDFSFMDRDSKINGRYSTVNAVRTANSLYQLIRVANNESVDSSLAEEAGHFAVGALGNSPLVTRLQNLLTPDVQKAIMGDEYDTVAYRDNPAREVAGYLVGRAINNDIDKQSNWTSLVNRIVDQVKKIFNSIKGDDISNARINAERTAEAIARGFMSTDFQGNVEQALETQETLYSAPDSNNIRVFKQIANILKLQTSEMRNINKDLWDKYNSLEGSVVAGRVTSSPSLFADLIAVDGIVDAVDLISNTMPEMIDKINSIQFNATDITTENANKIREVRTFITNALAILKVIEDATNERSLNRIIGSSEEVIQKLGDLSSTLHNAITGHNKLLSNLEQVEKKFYAKFLEDILGSKYVHRAARVVFQWKGIAQGKSIIKAIDAEDIAVSDLISQVNTDITLFERYFASMSNNSDVVGQLHDRVVKSANRMADRITLTYQDKLRLLQAAMAKDGIKDTRVFCEVSPKTGKLTGNVVGRHCRGDWENDWLEFRKKCNEEFFSTINLQGKTEFEKAALFADFFNPRRKLWHKTHSKWNSVNKSWDPNDSYLNPQYDNLSAVEKNYLGQYIAIKSEIDQMLDGNGVTHRLPQFKGSTADKIRNKRLTERTDKAILYTLRNELAETFLEDSEDTEFGSQLTYNTVDEDMFSNQLVSEREKMARIPLYGINKLKDSSLMSTDLFQSTLAYAGMASSYAAMNSIVGALEVGINVLKNRSVEGIRSEADRKETSRAYTRLSKFMDSNVYGINTPKFKIGKKLVVNKVSGALSGLASKIFLGGNVLGGVANLTMGATEVFKEALAGEHFSVRDWNVAHKIYWKDLPSNWLHAGDDVKEDKTSLFIRHFNVLNDNSRKERDWFTRKSKLVKLNPLGENLFMPYKVGEHYMQTMAYLAIANNTKLIDANGNPISLFNAYEVVPIDSSRPEAGNTLELKQGVKYLDKATGEVRDWSIEDESRFMDRAREVNNRMHGVYNNQDKVAIQRTIYGAALMAMRGYALGMLQRRFGQSMYSTVLEGESEGSYRTFAKVLLSMGRTPGLTARAILLPTSSKVKEEMLKAGFSANQYANMRRNWADMIFIAASFLLKALTAKPDDDDDDEDVDIATATAYYFASRLFSEQSAFNAPWGMIKESQVITNILPAGASVVVDMWDIASLFATQEEYKSSGSTYEKGDLKWEHKVERLLPFYRSYLLMQNPYQAAQSYQYGRTTGGTK